MSSDEQPFRHYDNVNEEQERDLWQYKSKKRIAIISISTILLVIIVAAVAGTSASRGKDSSDDGQSLPPVNSVKSVCTPTMYPVICQESLIAAGANSTTDPEALFVLSLQIALAEFTRVSHLPAKLANTTNDTTIVAAVNDCLLLIDDSVEQLNASLQTATPKTGGEPLINQTKVDDFRTWISTALTNVDICLDGFENTTGGFLGSLQAALQNSTIFTSNSLAIVTQIFTILDGLDIPPHRRLLALLADPDHLPAWVSAKDRKLLQTNPSGLNPNVVVAQDGSGQVTTINDAIMRIPKGNAERFVIYVKAGVYDEIVVIDKKTLNVMIVGDGMDKTIVTGSRSVGGKITTFTSATFAVMGKGFIARDIGFRNTAGPAKHQAVAFRSGADQSVYFRCSFDAYQDTLYVYANRQFYRECTVAGTVDFIFGNAAVVFQNCTIVPKEPMAGQKDTITAQSKSDPNMNTGISIHMCQMNGNVTSEVYFGRPWKNYSTVVIMKTFVGSLLTPAGWLPWTGTSAPSTIYYGEYTNSGPGASTTGRVNWEGYHPSLTVAEASKFAVDAFLGDNSWINATGVPFQPGL